MICMATLATRAGQNATPFAVDEVKMDTRRSAFTQTISIFERYCNVTLTFINDTWQRSVNALKNKAPWFPLPQTIRVQDTIFARYLHWFAQEVSQPWQVGGGWQRGE